ncbi:MAG: hypothetical protein ABIH23_15635 [bacterium]
MNIDLKKLENADTPQDVMDVYRHVKRYFVDDPDRKTWKDNRKKNWDAAYPLDVEEHGIWTAKEKEAMRKKDQIPIAINDLAKGVQSACAVITAKSPGLNFSPIGSSDLYVAELFKRGWDYVLNRNGGPITFYEFVKEAKVGALGCLEARHDPSKGIYGKICIEELDPENYYYDKRSKKRDHSDVSFGKAHLVTKKYALDTYEGLTEDDLKFDAISKDEAETPNKVDTVTGKDNYAIDTGSKKGLPETDKDEEENVWEIEDWELTKVKELWLMIPNQEKPGEYDREVYKTNAEIEANGWQIDASGKTAAKENKTLVPDPTTGEPVQLQALREHMNTVQAVIWPRRVEKRIQRIIIGKKKISEEENPLGVDSDNEPILPIVTLPHDRTLSGYPTCPTTRAYEITRSRNKRRMQSIYVVSKNIDAPIVMPQGAKWVKDEIHGDSIEVAKDSAFQPTRLLPGTTSAELVGMEQRDKEDISDEYDMPEVFRGKIPPGQSNIAGRTVLALQETVGVMSQPFTLAIESSLERLGKAVAALMLKVWPKSMWMRLIEPDELGTWQPEKEKEVDDQGNPVEPPADMIQQRWMDAVSRITGEDGKEPMSMIDLDVKVIAGSTQPTNRMAKSGVAIEYVKAGIYDAQAALEYMDDPMKDEVVERMERKRKEELEAVRQGQTTKAG